MRTVWDFRQDHKLHDPVKIIFTWNDTTQYSRFVYESNDVPLTDCIVVLNERASAHRRAIEGWFRVPFIRKHKIKINRLYDAVRPSATGAIVMFTRQWDYQIAHHPDLTHYIYFENEADAVTFAQEQQRVHPQ